MRTVACYDPRPGETKHFPAPFDTCAIAHDYTYMEGGTMHEITLPGIFSVKETRANRPPGIQSCCYVACMPRINPAAGRPLTIGGVARLALLRREDTWG